MNHLGDNTSLKCALASRFDASMMSAALKMLWDFSRVDLSRLGFVYQNRRNTDKKVLFDSVFSDLVRAFETLDTEDALPDLYCEANDLPSLPPFELDPIAKQMETNTKVLQTLRISVDNLPSTLSKPIHDHVSPQLQSLVESAQKLKDELTQLMSTSAKAITENQSKINENLSRITSASTSHSHATIKSVDRRNNIIIFGLQEKSLADTRKDVESILEFLCGRTVPFSDAFRLGRFNSASIDSPPRPLLVKLSNMWDKRLILAAKRNLKNFSTKRLFLREDLSPEARQKRAQQRKEKSENKGHTQHSQRSPSSSESIAEGDEHTRK